MEKKHTFTTLCHQWTLPCVANLLTRTRSPCAWHLPGLVLIWESWIKWSSRQFILWFFLLASHDSQRWHCKWTTLQRRTLLCKLYSTVISIVKPTRCTGVSNLFYFEMTLYMFRMVFTSIIRSSRLYIQLSNRYCCLLASKQTAVSDKCLLLYVQSWTPDDGQKDRPKHVECHSKIK